MKSNNLVGVLQFVLLLPAAFFMWSVFARGAFPPATEAQEFIHWFEMRTWTLWVLLLALPFAAFAAGGVALLRSESLKVLRVHFGTLCVAALQLASAGILAIVVLHMAAN